MLHSDLVTFRQYVAKKAVVFCDFDDIALIVQIFCLCLSDLVMLIFLRNAHTSKVIVVDTELPSSKVFLN